MEITIVTENKKQFLDLLLLADEQEEMIDKYLERGELFALYDYDLRSVCVVTQESDELFEIKNIATYKQYQNKSYAGKLLQYIFDFYKGKGKEIFVGTGDVPGIIKFYEKQGFVLSHRIENFFIDNYNHLMFEDGIMLKDMVYLKKLLK